MPPFEVIASIVIAAFTGGFLRDLIQGFFQRKQIKALEGKTDAEATKVIIESATTLLGPLTKRIAELETEATFLRNELRSARREVHSAREEIATLRAEVAGK